MNISIRVDGLTKSFGGHRVLDSVSHDFAPGRVTALVGPNGAGKTTLLKCLLGLVRPDAGRVTVAGHAIDRGGAYRRDIGYMPQLPHFPAHMTGWELAAMLDDLRAFAAEPDEGLVEAFEVRRDMRKPFGALSGGTRQKVNAALAFRYAPPVLILDEPTAGLDPVSSLALKDEVRRRRDDGVTVLVTSHDLGQLEALADEIFFLLEGRLAFAGPLGRLLADTGGDTLEEAIAELMRAAASERDGHEHEGHERGQAGAGAADQGERPPTIELVS